ncbi:MAG: hypothetical protein PVF49_08290 [Anaerolineales bacterium]
MHKSGRLLLLAAALTAIVAGASSAGTASGETLGPRREKVIQIEVMIYEWWLMDWSSGQSACQLFIEHEGLPTAQDVSWFCGDLIYKIWFETEPCPPPESPHTHQCQGLYAHLASTTPTWREVVLELPPATVQLDVDGCDLNNNHHRCSQLPDLIFEGIEPLPNQTITEVEGSLGGFNFHCPGGLCRLPLRPTGPEGANLSFLARSSYGDTSTLYTGIVRVVRAPIDENGQPGWYVDILSSQWLGSQLQSCSQMWEALPQPGGPPAWLSTPHELYQLSSHEPYAFLAGLLIANGQVEAIDCPNAGLLSNGYANQCGLERAQEAINLWQNQFDATILNVSYELGLPAQLIKNLFARESQFWPGMLNDLEAGLGHLTEIGTDATLLWNESFYSQFCPLVLDESVCQQGYPQLAEEEQELLRAALFNQVSSDCVDCSLGIDLSQTNFSIQLFAETLLANCEQVGRMVRNTTGDSPGNVSSYEDLWRFTLVNYSSGPGCLSDALLTANSRRLPMDWENVSPLLDESCSLAVDYVEDITLLPTIPPSAAPDAPSLQP